MKVLLSMWIVKLYLGAACLLGMRLRWAAAFCTPQMASVQPAHRVWIGRMTCHCTAVPCDATATATEYDSSSSMVTIRDVTPRLSRSSFLKQALLVATTAGALAPRPRPARAFEGGVGGLGKTKPETGCKLFDETAVPVQNEAGTITAEIRSVTGRPILVEFQAPWPLLTTSGGLEARDLTSSESAFVQVVPAPKGGDWRGNKKVFQQLLMESVFASKGKFGAYGAPFDVRVKTIEASADTGYTVTFTTLTPAMRESEREAYIKPQEVDGTLVLLVVGTTRARFPSNEMTFQRVASSFQAIAAPESNLRSRQ